MATKKNEMTVERMLEIWMSPYGKGEKPVYSEIYPHYHPNCRFQDSVQAFQGRDIFIDMCERLMQRCAEIYMDVHNIAKAENENVFLVEWTMSMRFKMSPLTPMYGATRLTVDEDGLITMQRDYYDLWGDIFDAIPGFNKMYRWFVRTVMG